MSFLSWNGKAHDEQVAWFRGFIERLNEQNASLTQQIIELKRDGFARPTPQMAHQAVTTNVDPRILKAIRSVASEGSRLESELLQFAEAAMMAEDAEVEEIADQILAGSSLGDD